MNVLNKNLFPFTDRSRRFNSIREVLIIVRVLNLLNNLRWFTNVINKLTSSSSDRTNLKNTTSNFKISNNTRRFRYNTSDSLILCKVSSVVNNLKNSRSYLPTRVCRYKSLGSCSSKRITLIYKLSF